MKEIEEKINKIFKTDTGIDFQKDTHLKDKKLMGTELNIPPRTLVHIYYKMRKANLNVSKDKILEGRFDTFRHVCEVITK